MIHMRENGNGCHWLALEDNDLAGQARLGPGLIKHQTHYYGVMTCHGYHRKFMVPPGRICLVAQEHVAAPHYNIVFIYLL